ncbi:LptF/LptG family permease [Ascidiimonas aurantiaca]|uniref:LptF/LptG family permease n=1 Tax=Ascidiimonas aurantiaca TaxID=1685432 RepID=UPI0030ED1E1A
MKIIDRYILRKYLSTFFVMMLLFIPIGIMIDVSEKVDKMIEREVPFEIIVSYYLDFTVYFANFLFPIFLFLSVIWFTSKLANNTEIIAILSSGISYTRFLKPYLMGAAFVAILAFFLGMFLVPNASKGYNEFRYKYLKKNVKDRETTNLFNQLNDNEFIYVSSFEPNNKIGYNFTLEHFEGTELTYKISAKNIRWIEKDSLYRLSSYEMRYVGEREDSIITQRRKDTLFSFNLDDLTPVSYIAETKNLFELNSFIEKEIKKGSSNINRYRLVQYRRWSFPVAAFILTIIAVAVSSKKRRGGMGVNLALGIAIAFIYIFFDKVFGTMADKSGFSPLLAVIIPNAVFGVLALYLLQNAKR